MGKRVRAPVFIFHGTHDMEVPFEHGETLYEACPAELAYDPWWVKEAGHNDIEINHKSHYFEHLLKFLRALEAQERNWRKGSENGWQPLLSTTYNKSVGASGHAPAYSYEAMSH